MPHGAKAVANYFLERARDDRVRVDPMKIQKLVYIAHGFYLGFTKEPLVEEGFEAWTYGPVCRTLYKEFRMFGSGQITKLARNKFSTPRLPESAQRERKILAFVWKRYGDLGSIDLSKKTHEKEGPWAKAIAESHQVNSKISDVRIEEYYRDVMIPRISAQRES